MGPETAPAALPKVKTEETKIELGSQSSLAYAYVLFKIHTSLMLLAQDRAVR